jgi:hypothetical protein
MISELRRIESAETTKPGLDFRQRLFEIGLEIGKIFDAD